ncbi:MAG: hypothetical protein NC222_06585 [Staphylococcus sp.]|nr:hypothetical protein [Staphylococcus sp.]
MALQKTKQKEVKEISKELIERNKTQKKVFINLKNIDTYFGENDTEPLSYHFILNLLRQKITVYFGKTQDFAQKEELAHNCIAKIYSSFKRRLTALEEQKKDNPEIKAELFFYISQFYCYVEHTARNEIILYKSKNRHNILEYREGVDYTQPLESFVGHPVYDTDDLMPSDFETSEEDNNLNTEETENEEEIDEMYKEETEEKPKKNKEKRVLSQSHLEKIHLENELDKKENELHLNMFFENNKMFTEEEKRLIIGIYNNDQKEDVFAKEALLDLQQTTKKDATLQFFAKKRYNEVLFNLQQKLSKDRSKLESFKQLIGGI